MYKFTNKEDMMKFVDAFTAANADQPCTIPFGEVIDGMKKYYEVMGMTIDLVNLIREEAELKKHHRAYLHVREELEDTADEAMERIVELLRNGSAPMSVSRRTALSLTRTRMRKLSPSPRKSMTAWWMTS